MAQSIPITLELMGLAYSQEFDNIFAPVVNNNNNNNNNICLFPPFADFSELQVGSGKALTNIQLYI